jgi:raffinose/stachyose/melibiose transport system permease protein
MKERVHTVKTKMAGWSWVLLALVSLIFIFPFYFIIITSFKSGQDLSVNPIGLPIYYHFENFRNVFFGTGVFRSVLNSLFVSLGAIGAGIAVYMLSSFGIYRLKTKMIGTIIFSIILFGLMIPFVGFWQVIITYRKFLLYNNLFGVILGLVGGQLPFCTLLIVGHMRRIPADLIDSAEIDGARDLQLFRHLILPLSRPIILTTAIFLLVESWNNLIMPLLLLRDDWLLTLPLKLKSVFYREYAPKYELFFAGALITSLPFIVTYILLQKYFVYGYGGALKE